MAVSERLGRLDRCASATTGTGGEAGTTKRPSTPPAAEFRGGTGGREFRAGGCEFQRGGRGLEPLGLDLRLGRLRPGSPRPPLETVY
eukprot:1188698-Prorocentrum_minimum.AAC.1